MVVKNSTASVQQSDNSVPSHRTHISKSMKLKLIAGTLVLLILALVFNASLNLNSLDKLYLESVVFRYGVIGKDLQRYIEESPYFGKDIRELAEMDRILEDMKSRITREITAENIFSVSVALPKGLIPYSTDKKLVGTILPKQARFSYENNDAKKDSSDYVKYQNTYITALPVRDGEKKWRATIIIAFDDKQIKELHDAVFNKNVRTIGIIVVCGAVLLTLFDVMILNTTYGRRFSKRNIFIIICFIVILSQIVFSGLNINDFNNHCLQISSEKAEIASTGISKDALFSIHLREIIVDSLTVLVISIFFFVEILILFSQFIEREFENPAQRMKIHHEVIRPAVFLLLFGVDISISFLPLHMETLYEPILGLSKDMVMGLPISAKVFTTAVSFLTAGTWSDHRGWHEPFLVGFFLAGMGLIGSALSSDGLQFIVSQALLGFGYGLSLMSSQGFVALYTNETNRAQGFTRLFAGTVAGSITGGAAGAMLAERIGYNPVFFLGAAIVFSVIAYTIFFMRNAFQKPEHRAVEQPSQSAKTGQILHFLFDRNVLCLLLFSVVPVYIAMVGFLYYFSPVYLDRIGASESDIGRVLMLNGFCVIYIGPLMSMYIDASKDKKTYIAVGGILGSLALITFYFIDGLAGTAIAMLFMGLSNSFNFASQTAYLLRLKVTQDLGIGKALAILRSLGRSGQVFGPIIFGWIIANTEIIKGVTYLGFAYLFITVLFLLIAREDEKYF